MYAWSRRGRQPALLVVSVAFLVYFSKLIIEILPVGELHDILISSIMDFITLGIFFLALVVKPQRSHSAEDDREEKDITFNQTHALEPFIFTGKMLPFASIVNSTEGNGTNAGPLNTLPFWSKAEPWHGQKISLELLEYSHWQQACVHNMLIALTNPSLFFMSMLGYPLYG